MVRSRKRKATQPEDGRRDRSMVSMRQGGAAQVRVRDRRAQEAIGISQGHLNSYRRVSKKFGVRYSSSERCGFVEEREAGTVAFAAAPDSKVSYYFTIFLDFMHVFRLRQFFEVCGILSNVY